MDISGKDVNELWENILLISFILDIFHLDISGNDIKELHLANIAIISVTLDVFHFDISGNSFND